MFGSADGGRPIVTSPGDDLPPNERANYAADGPIATALEWVRTAIGEQDLARAWPLTDPDLRRLIAQSWMINEAMDARADRDDLVEQLAAETPPAGVLWNRLCTSTRWGTMSATDPVSPGVELVRLVDEAETRSTVPAGGAAVLVQNITVRYSERWRVCAVGRSIPRPGWPPTADTIEV